MGEAADSVVEYPQDIEGTRHVLSLKAMIAMVCLCAIAASTSVSTTLSIDSCDSALKTTRGSGKESVSSCFSSSEQSIQQLTDNLLRLSTDSVIVSLDLFFGQFSDQLDRMTAEVMESVVLMNLPRHDPRFVFQFLPNFQYALRSLGSNGLASIGIGVQTDNGNDTILVALDDIESLPGNVVYDRGDGLGGIMGQWINVTDNIIDIAPFPYNGADVALLRHYAAFPQVLIPGQKWWSNPIVVSEFTGMIHETMVVHPVQGPVYTYATATFSDIGGFLKDLAESVKQRSGLETESFIVQARDWLYDAYEASPIASIRTLEVDTTGYVIAQSHGNPAALDPETGRPVIHTDVNSTHSVIRGIARGVHSAGGYAVAQKEISRISVDVNDTTTEYFVTVSRYSRGGLTGLDMWLVLGAEAQFIVGQIEQERINLAGAIAKNKKEVEEQVDEDRVILFVVVVAVAVLLSILTSGLTALALSPFNTLREDMALVAEMQMDRPSTKFSVFQEVGSMQVSFEKMKRNLLEFRAYVPVALLGTGEKVSRKPPTGVVTVVFTDIKDSTLLWERSATAMNKAMEIHNDIIRDAIKKTEGYEVKTIGDSFMVTFQEPKNGVAFCLRVHEGLAAASWPVGLSLHQGLLVRIGAHVGEVIVEENPLTGRTDYRGATVAVAARVEGKADPGTTCITKQLHDAVSGDMAYLCNPAVQRRDSDVVLKGLDGTYVLYSLNTNKEAPGHDSAIPASAQSSSIEKSSFSLPKPSEVSTSVSRVNESLSKKTGLFLVSGEVTVAVFRLKNEDGSSDVFQQFNLMINTVAEAAQQTDGVLGSVVGKSITVSWNTTRATKRHAAGALRLMAQLEKRGGPAVYRIGVATGRALHGNVGSQHNRYQTVCGFASEVASLAADTATALSVFCIFADATSGFEAAGSLSVALRLIDLWVTPSAKPVRVYVVNGEVVRDLLESRWDSYSEGDDNTEYNRHVLPILSGDNSGILHLEAMLTRDPNDVILRTIIDNAQLKAYPTHVSFSNLPPNLPSRRPVHPPVPPPTGA